MNSKSIVEKIEEGQEISNNELGYLMVEKLSELRVELQDDINRLAFLTMEEFKKVRQEMAAGFQDVEFRLGKRIDFNNEKTAKRLDWVEAKLSKLA